MGAGSGRGCFLGSRAAYRHGMTDEMTPLHLHTRYEERFCVVSGGTSLGL